MSAWQLDNFSVALRARFDSFAGSGNLGLAAMSWHRDPQNEGKVMPRNPKYFAVFALLAEMVFSPARAQTNQAVRVCNDSGTHDIYVASVINSPMVTMIGQFGWVGEGWDQVRPSRCVDVFEDTSSNTFIWLRVVSEGRFIPGYNGRGEVGSSFSATNDSFCIDPAKIFKWGQSGPISSCGIGRGIARFSFYLNVLRRATFIIHVDPDSIVRSAPIDEVALERPPAPPPDTDYPLKAEWTKGFLAGFSRLNGIANSLGLDTHYGNGDLQRVCVYRAPHQDDDKYYYYWGRQIDRETLKRLHNPETEELAQYGVRPVFACPFSEKQAIAIKNKNIREWRDLH